MGDGYKIEGFFVSFDIVSNGMKRGSVSLRGLYFRFILLFFYTVYKCQISSLYCFIVRSEEKYPASLMFTSIFLAQSIRSR